MELKNYQEDLVLYVTDLVLRDRPDVKPSKRLLRDVAAYALNRLPPKYIQSERGFTRLAADHWINGSNGEGLVSLVEVLLLVNRAIDVVQHRRKSDYPFVRRAPAKKEAPDLKKYWHNFPYLIGRIVDLETRQPLIGASVTLFIDKRLAEQAEPSWKNPYLTNAATRGFFSFLPKPWRSDSASQKFSLVIAAECEGYRKATLRRTICTRGEYLPIQYILSEKILNLKVLSLMPDGGPLPR